MLGLQQKSLSDIFALVLGFPRKTKEQKAIDQVEVQSI